MRGMWNEVACYDVSDAVSGVLEVAGLTKEAERVRDVGTSAGEVAGLLRRVRAEATGMWAPALQEVCFWAEAVVWAAWAGDESLEEYRARLRAAIDEGYALVRTH